MKRSVTIKALAVSLTVLGPLAGAQSAFAESNPIVLAQTTPAPARPAAAAAPAPVPVPAPMPAVSEARAAIEPRSASYETTALRVAVISVGAVAGVFVANAVTAGMITPILVATGGNTAAIAAGGTYAVAAGEAAVTAVGAVIGGYASNWLYGP
ncbi:hypothetical protein ABLE91_18035 [Aquabacter sp. CN5-332]|uniref:hypothetical protein n=1 Tax=Aquabacter sp. CN5-332 TaxID=3156608 RepID=UPI0032B4E3C8